MISEQVNKIRKVAKCVYLTTDKEVVDDISSTINQFADTAANMERSAGDCGGWVPCKERLPEKVGNYIIHVKTGTNEGYVGVWCYQRGVHLSGKQTYIDNKQGYWASPYNGDPINEPLSKRVIAWQPLPEPYHEP